MLTENTIEMRGIPSVDIERYFILAGGRRGVDKKIIGSDWEVIISDEYYSFIGPIRISTVKITFKAQEQYCKEMIAQFNKKFIRAGG